MLIWSLLRHSKVDKMPLTLPEMKGRLTVRHLDTLTPFKIIQRISVISIGGHALRDWLYKTGMSLYDLFCTSHQV